jgi:hypothetical protein
MKILLLVCAVTLHHGRPDINCSITIFLIQGWWKTIFPVKTIIYSPQKQFMLHYPFLPSQISEKD